MKGFAVRAAAVLLLAGCAGTQQVEGRDGSEQMPLLCEDGWTHWEVDGTRNPPVLLNRAQVLTAFAQRVGRPSRSFTAEVTMRVTRTGAVDLACVSESSGWKRFDELVLGAAYSLRFSPGTTNGRAGSVTTVLAFSITRR